MYCTLGLHVRGDGSPCATLVSADSPCTYTASEEGKRLFLFVNSTPTRMDAQRLRSAGIETLRISGFGHEATPTTALTKVKTLLRLGRVTWLHITVCRHHWQQPTWTTQCCRLAHRSATPWTILFQPSPWAIKPFELLRRHKSVKTDSKGDPKRVWMASRGGRPWGAIDVELDQPSCAS